MVEIINVKERLGFLAYSLIFFALSFTDAAIWNDGTHFLYQLINHGLFVDHLWNRYSDIIYQIPTLGALKFFGWTPFSYWVFKATLYFLPLLSLAAMALRKKSHDEQEKGFVWAVFFLILPFGLMFPASIINITVTFGTVALAIALKNRVSKWDLVLLLFSHLVLFFGHELGVLVILALILHYSLKMKDTASRWHLGFEILFFILFVAAKYELLIKNKLYLSNLRLADESIGYFFLTVVLFSGIVKLVSKTTLANITAGIVLFYFSIAMFANGQDEFYFNVSSVRFSLVPFVVILFMAFRFWPSTLVSKSFVVHCTFILFAMSLKAFITWSSFVLPSSSLAGCRVLPKHELQWSPPGWTVPLLSVLKQYSLKPKNVWVLSDSLDKSECLRFGDYLVLDKDYQYHLIGFHWRIDGTHLLQNVPQAEFPIPYHDLKRELVLPRVGVIKFFNHEQLPPVGKCLNVEIIHLPQTASKLIVEINGQEKHRQEVVSNVTLSLPISARFRDVMITMNSDSDYSMNIRSVSVGSCR
jgi:hypothetical protein